MWWDGGGDYTLRFCFFNLIFNFSYYLNWIQCVINTFPLHFLLISVKQVFYCTWVIQVKKPLTGYFDEYWWMHRCVLVIHCRVGDHFLFSLPSHHRLTLQGHGRSAVWHLPSTRGGELWSELLFYHLPRQPHGVFGLGHVERRGSQNVGDWTQVPDGRYQRWRLASQETAHPWSISFTCTYSNWVLFGIVMSLGKGEKMMKEFTGSLMDGWMDGWVGGWIQYINGGKKGPVIDFDWLI